jgi:flavin reductase (DIM6/NTAB) family NADH-FMN oxidoreductase RutF/uncharacterized protein YciI
MPTPRVPLPLDKRAWQPSLIPGAVALIGSVAADGTPNVAPKSWIQMASFEPPVLVFSGQPGGRTEANILATGCFGVSLVHGGLAARAWDCVQWQGAERIEKACFTLEPATRIAAPLVAECRAWLECRLCGHHRVGGALAIYGEIVAASIRPAILERPARQRYPALDLAVFLEEGLYATLDRARPAAPEEVGPDDARWVYTLTPVRPDLIDRALVQAHVAHLARLEDEGVLELCGPFADHSGGMVILRGVDEVRARAILASDPFVASGAELGVLREWHLSHRDNRHMGVG